MLGMEVRDGQQQTPRAGEAACLGEHDVSVGAAHPGVDDERRVVAEHDADVRHEVDPPVGEDEDAGCDLGLAAGVDEQGRSGHSVASSGVVGVGPGGKRPGREALDGLAESVGLLERRAVGAAVEEHATAVRRPLGDPLGERDRPVGVAAAPGGEHRHREALDNRALIEPRLRADDAGRRCRAVSGGRPRRASRRAPALPPATNRPGSAARGAASGARRPRRSRRVPPRSVRAGNPQSASDATGRSRARAGPPAARRCRAAAARRCSPSTSPRA